MCFMHIRLFKYRGCLMVLFVISDALVSDTISAAVPVTASLVPEPLTVTTSRERTSCLTVSAEIPVCCSTAGKSVAGYYSVECEHTVCGVVLPFIDGVADRVGIYEIAFLFPFRLHDTVL